MSAIKLKVGDVVRIREDSRWYGTTATNPINEWGKVTSIVDGPIVEWEAGKNSYVNSDLITKEEWLALEAGAEIDLGTNRIEYDMLRYLSLNTSADYVQCVGGAGDNFNAGIVRVNNIDKLIASLLFVKRVLENEPTF
jgi:hypothetical protein